MYAQTNAPYPNRIQIVCDPFTGPFSQEGPLGAFDPRRDLNVYVDGVLQTVQTFSFDEANNRYLLFMANAINLQGVIQIVHHVPNPPFSDFASPVSPAFVLAETASVPEAFGLTATTAAVITNGQNINFIAVVCNNYDSNPSEATLSDTINGVASGNIWTPVPSQDAHFGFNYGVFFFYCYNPHVGVNHVFTLTSTGNGCPSLCVMAFKGMPSSGGPETDFASYGVGGTWGPMGSSFPSNFAVSPATAGNLVVCGAGVGNIVGKTVSVDSGVTIAGSVIPFASAGITAGYLVASSGAVGCSGNVTFSGGGSTIAVEVFTPSVFLAPQTCTGTVTVTGRNTGTNLVAVQVSSSTGYMPGMVVALQNFSGSIGSTLNTSCNVVSVGAGVITVTMANCSIANGVYTGQTAGTIQQQVTLSGFTGGAAVINGGIVLVESVAGNVVTLLSGDTLTNGTHTGQTAGLIGFPINPLWSWSNGDANTGGGSIVIFPGTVTPA